jgi:hypothetical protein
MRVSSITTDKVRSLYCCAHLIHAMSKLSMLGHDVIVAYF